MKCRENLFVLNGEVRFSLWDKDDAFLAELIPAAKKYGGVEACGVSASRLDFSDATRLLDMCIGIPNVLRVTRDMAVKDGIPVPESTSEAFFAARSESKRLH